MEVNIHTLAARLAHEVNVSVLGKQTDSFDILTMANLVSSLDSASYFNHKMSGVRNFANSIDLLTHAMSLRSFEGLILEFGVASGRTINHIASLTEQPVHGFDVFSGLPEDWRTGYEKGMFAQAIPKTLPNVELVVGLYEQTLDGFIARTREPVALLHVDCDLYSSTRTVFAKLADRIVPGTVIVFDEYFNYPGWREHEFKAFAEFCAWQRIKYAYQAMVSRHQQVCVVITQRG